MRRGSLLLRFYVESALALVGAVLLVLTLVWNEWIEIVFHLDPDAGNGSAEFLLSVALLAIAGVSAWMARTEWRRSGQVKAVPTQS
jgi:hypothetical protein